MHHHNLYVDVHLLQDVPPSNLNRDDSGSPKSARYGGVDRLRVSSQAWKRATRLDFMRHLDPAQLGLRTRRVQDTVIDALITQGFEREQAVELAGTLLGQIGITASTKKAAETSYLLFLSRPQVEKLARDVRADVSLWNDPDALKSAIDVKGYLGSGHSLDVALFGRMVADLAGLNVDASAQVSHAIATHAAQNQSDYFTAVDDAQQDDETGAGMIGTVEFNSATLYRYATVSVPELVSNMDDEAAALAGLEQFVRSFALSMPSGKQNTFAAHSRPGFVWLVVRDDQPVNYVSAFEKPVEARQGGYFAGSVQALTDFVRDEAARWGDRPLAQVASYVGGGEGTAAVFGDSVAFDDAVATVRDVVVKALAHD